MTTSLAPIRQLQLPVLCGLLLCAAATAMESLSQPLQNLPVEAIRALVGSIAWTWVLSGLWWALMAPPLAHLSARRLGALIVPLAFAITLIHLGTWEAGFTISLDGGSSDLMGSVRQPAALFLHVLWANLFFSGGCICFRSPATGGF